MQACSIYTDWNLSRKIRTKRVRVNKKITCQPEDFTVPAGHSVKEMESEKLNKYLDFTREQKIYPGT